MTSASSRPVENGFMGPLTTTFTPPASCNALSITSVSSSYPLTRELTVVSSNAISLSTYTSQATFSYSHAEMYNDILDPSCFPSSTAVISGIAYFSPGICPSNWTGAETRVTSGETAVKCCPSGFAHDTQFSRCLSTLTANATHSVVLYFNEKRVNETPTLTLVTAQEVFASPLYVRYRDTDNALLASLTATGSPSADQASLTPSASAIPSDAAGLSTGAKIGIGIGVPLAAIAFGIVGFLVFWRRRRAAHAAPDALDDSKAEAAAMGPAPYGPDGPPQELPGDAWGELAGSDVRRELAGSDARRELMGSDARRELAGNDAGGELEAGGYDVPNKAGEGYTPTLAVREVDAEKAVGFGGGPVQSAAELYPDHR